MERKLRLLDIEIAQQEKDAEAALQLIIHDRHNDLQIGLLTIKF